MKTLLTGRLGLVKLPYFLPAFFATLPAPPKANFDEPLLASLFDTSPVPKIAPAPAAVVSVPLNKAPIPCLAVALNNSIQFIPVFTLLLLPSLTIPATTLPPCIASTLLVQDVLNLLQFFND